MAINDTVLADFELACGDSVRIERTENCQIHIHIDNMRLNLSESEFEELAATTTVALEELTDMKQL